MFCQFVELWVCGKRRCAVSDVSTYICNVLPTYNDTPAMLSVHFQEPYVTRLRLANLFTMIEL